LERLAWDAFRQTDTARAQLRAMTASDSTSNAAKSIREYIAKLDTLGGLSPRLGGGFGGGGFFGSSAARPTLVQLISRLLNQLGTFDNGDVAPTAAMLAAYKSACDDVAKSVSTWRALNGGDLSGLNAALTTAGRTALAKVVVAEAPDCAR
jgi:hypothetical protein